MHGTDRQTDRRSATLNADL